MCHLVGDRDKNKCLYIINFRSFMCSDLIYDLKKKLDERNINNLGNMAHIMT